nr:penicillin acylase family protein [Kitasatospora sp. MAA4]
MANPHLPWTGSHRFYEVQLTIPGTMDVSGAGLYGTPLVEIGHTQGLAWTHTTAYDQHASLYQLKLVPGDPTAYTVDGKTEQMNRQTVPVTVLGADGKPSTITQTLYTSRYGPIISYGWTGTTAYAALDANADNLRSMNEWLAMDQSQNLDQLRAAQTTYQGMPWTHTIATETDGKTYFADSSVVPHLTDDQLKQCTMPSPHDLPTVLDGSTTACAWGSDPDSIEPGLYGPSHWPTLSRTDYVANSNNGPYLTNPAAPITGLPGVYNTDTQLAQRPQLGLTMIAQRIGGTDGLGAPGFTLPTLQAAMLGNRNYSAELGRTDVVAMCQAHPALTATDGTSVDVRAACETLAAWNARDDADSEGAPLWTAFYQDLARTAGRYESWATVPYDPAQPLTTPRGVNGSSASVQKALADAVESFTAKKLPLDTTVGAMQKWAGVPLPGCTNLEGCFDIVQADAGSGASGAVYPTSADDGADGSSFIAATELTPQGPRTRTLLTYGESVNQSSPHYSDQTALFSKKQWVTERFTEAEIKADPTLQTTTLRG